MCSEDTSLFHREAIQNLEKTWAEKPPAERMALAQWPVTKKLKNSEMGVKRMFDRIPFDKKIMGGVCKCRHCRHRDANRDWFIQL